jgi:hypothetical protein
MANHKKIAAVTFGVTYAMFMTEALIHYNMGVHKDKSQQGFVLPPKKDFVKLGVVVGLFSILNGIVVNEIIKNNT